MQGISRREVLGASGALLGTTVLGVQSAQAQDKSSDRKLKVLHEFEYH